jgi:hypothetical protein
MNFVKKDFVKKDFGMWHNVLNTAFCQFTAGASKTAKAMQYIKHFCEVKRFTDENIEHGIHHMTIVMTNNSLLETKMWKHRGQSSLKGYKVAILSSKKDSDYINIGQIIHGFIKAKKADELPDILIMCTHGSRTENINELIDSLQNGNCNFTKIGIHQITMTIMFDEADKTIDLIISFIKEALKNLEKNNKIYNTVIRDIHYITATPMKEFWKSLKKIGIEKLKSINHQFGTLGLKHSELMKNYRKIEDHTIHYDVDDKTEDPVHYASLVIPKIIKRRENKEVLTVFAPGHLWKESHERMKDLFQANNFTTLVLNSDGKGWYSQDNKFTSWDEFNTTHNIQGEAYKTLVKWRELNPSEDLAITGYLNLERGITFNTNGFNFTDMLVSSYHVKNLASLIQILGRANGDVEYVKIMNIWSPKYVISSANEYIEAVNDTHSRNPEEFNESDFRKASPRDRKREAISIPAIINLTSDEINEIKKRRVGRTHDEEYIKELIGNKNPELRNTIVQLKKKQITLPHEPKSIKKHITDFENAAKESKGYSIDITKKELEEDLYQVFIDDNSGSEKLIVSCYYGSKLKQKTDIQE